MIGLLARLMIKDYRNTEDERVRRSYGVLCGIVGICLNVLLFAAKYAVGFLSGSIAVTADAFNNLSDAGSSLVTLIGFRLAGKRADKGHPLGHGRVEYVSGLVISIMILVMGVEILRSSLEKVLHPQPANPEPVVIAVLFLSVCVKFYIAFYNRRLGKKLDSAAMRATALDSCGDMAATAIVLLSLLASRWFPVDLDGYGGVAVALFILWAGCSAAKDTLNLLIGQAPDEKLVNRIHEIVLSHPEILGYHDLIVHDYGPGHRLISLHGEVSGETDIYRLHDVIDRIERELAKELGCDAVIHMDPVPVNDSRVCEMRRQMAEAVKVIHPQMTCHDVHLLREDERDYVGFDVVLPEDCGLTETEVTERLIQLVRMLWNGAYEPIIKIDYE